MDIEQIMGVAVGFSEESAAMDISQSPRDTTPLTITAKASHEDLSSLPTQSETRLSGLETRLSGLPDCAKASSVSSLQSFTELIEDDGALTRDEDRETGVVALQVWLLYPRVLGALTSAGILFFLAGQNSNTHALLLWICP